MILPYSVVIFSPWTDTRGVVHNGSAAADLLAGCCAWCSCGWASGGHYYDTDAEQGWTLHKLGRDGAPQAGLTPRTISNEIDAMLANTAQGAVFAKCAVCGLWAPLYDGECPDCRH